MPFFDRFTKKKVSTLQIVFKSGTSVELDRVTDWKMKHRSDVITELSWEQDKPVRTMPFINVADVSAVFEVHSR